MITPAPIKALACLCFFPPIAEKSKPPALQVVGDSLNRIRSNTYGHHIPRWGRLAIEENDLEAVLEPLLLNDIFFGLFGDKLQFNGTDIDDI